MTLPEAMQALKSMSLDDKLKLGSFLLVEFVAAQGAPFAFLEMHKGDGSDPDDALAIAIGWGPALPTMRLLGESAKRWSSAFSAGNLGSLVRVEVHEMSDWARTVVVCRQVSEPGWKIQGKLLTTPDDQPTLILATSPSREALQVALNNRGYKENGRRLEPGRPHEPLEIWTQEETDAG